MWNNWEKWKWKVNAGQNSLRSLAESWSLLWKVFWRQSTEHSSRAAGASAAANILQRTSVHLSLCRSCCTAWRPDWEPGKLIINGRVGWCNVPVCCFISRSLGCRWWPVKRVQVAKCCICVWARQNEHFKELEAVLNSDLSALWTRH